MSFNSDELVPPNWLDAEFLQKVLESDGKLQNVKVIDYKIAPATAVGDHYASIMFRVNINYSVNSKQNERKSVIVKTMPFADSHKKDLLSSFDVMANETFMFTKVLNRCSEMLENVGYKDPLCAKLIYHSNKPTEVLVFEDLKQLGYFMIPHNIPSESEFKIVYEKLGQFHAATFKMATDGYEDLKSTKGFFFNMPEIKKLDLLPKSLKILGEILKNESGFEKLSKKLLETDIDYILDKCKKLGNRLGSYNVLNHGDFHVRNMMFGSNEKNISKVVLVDFQLCHWGSPALDLVYMDCIAPVKLREQMHKHYFDKFIEVLDKLNYSGKRPKFDELRAEVKLLQFFDIIYVAFLAPIMMLNRNKIDFQMDELFMDINVQRRHYKNASYISHAKEKLRFILEDGLLDKLIK